MTNGADFQQQQELLEQQRLLTYEAMFEWFKNNIVKAAFSPEDGLTMSEYYLKEHGLPLDSKIEGL